VADQGHTNLFVEVHNRVKAFKDRVNDRNKADAELREGKLVEEAKNIRDKETNSSDQTAPVRVPPDSV